MSIKKGLFVTLEGGEGVGKTTNFNLIKSRLSDAGIPFIETREPGGTPMAEEVRNLLLSKREEAVDPLAELLLVFAARSQHLQKKIIPALNNGSWVLCDRFTDSTYAYQGGGRGIEIKKIAELENLVQNGLHPDVTFLLDAPIEVGMERARSRAELDRFESEDLEFFENMRKQFLHRASEQSDRFVLVDASKDLESVQKQITRQLDRIVEDWRSN